MPDRTPGQRLAIRNGYLHYRRATTLARTGERGAMSASMIAAINALDSKLAVRGRVEPESFPMRGGPSVNVDLVNQIKAAKKSQEGENRARASQALKTFLQSAGGRPGAVELKDELEMLAAYFVSQSFDVKWIPGPLKKLDKAMGKTEQDYGFAYGLNKDLVRGTLATESQGVLKTLAFMIKTTCTGPFGMHLVKQDEQKSHLDGGDSKTGYSGWNFVVQFQEHVAFGAEIQANTFDLMYGKMSMKDFRSQLGFSPAQYTARQERLNFPGGLGHALYDIQDTGRAGTTPAAGDWARSLASDYNDACRGQFRNTTLLKLNERLMEFGGTLTSDKAKALWKHGISECGWSPLARTAHSKVVVTSARLTSR